MKIPAGVDEGDRIRLTGEGEAGVNGGPPATSTSSIHLKPHAVFQREQRRPALRDADQLRRPRRSAARSRFPTLDGHAKIKIPAGNADRQGVPPARQGHQAACAAIAHGDLLCHVVVETPVNLTARQKELLREFEAINAQDPAAHNPRAKYWLDRVKEFFGRT